MKHKMFSVYDQVAKAWLPPFYYHNEFMAIRTFSDCINNPQHQFGMNQSDYTLFEIGEWDDDSGKIETYAENKLLGNGTKFISQQE